MLAQALMHEVTHEYANTRKMLEKVPFESFAWQPHAKSMTLGKLTTHIATLPKFITLGLSADYLDLTKGALAPGKYNNMEELLADFDSNVAKAKETLAATSDEEMMKLWSLQRGEMVLFTVPKAAVVRSFALNHIIHHRAQLQVYLRMLDIPVPGMYGPSADEV